MFNENLLIQCKKPHFRGQHIDLTLSPEIINDKEEYEVEVKNHRK